MHTRVIQEEMGTKTATNWLNQREWLCGKSWLRIKSGAVYKRRPPIFEFLLEVFTISVHVTIF